MAFGSVLAHHCRQHSDEGNALFDLPAGIVRRIALLLAAAFFVYAGISHFWNPEFFLAIMPPYLPAHLELVYISGIFEILGGLGLLLSRTRRAAGLGLLALLVAVFPANIHMALNPQVFIDAGTPLWGLYVRLPIQFLLMAWVFWVTRPRSADASISGGQG